MQYRHCQWDGTWCGMYLDSMSLFKFMEWSKSAVYAGLWWGPEVC